MQDSIIYQSIIELSKDSSFKNVLFDYQELKKLNKEGTGYFFKKKTIWNQLKNIPTNELDDKGFQKSVEISDSIFIKNFLFFMKSGLIFTRYGIVNAGIVLNPKIPGKIFKNSLFYFKKRDRIWEGLFEENIELEESTYASSKYSISGVKLFDSDTLLLGDFYIKETAMESASNNDLNFLTENYKYSFFNLQTYFGNKLPSYYAIKLTLEEAKFFKELDKLVSIKRNGLLKNRKKKEESRINKLNESKNEIFKELDKDGNGIIDVIEGNDFDLLLKKHQKSIIEINRDYVQQFVKVSSYIKTKKKNIQSIFNSIKDIADERLLKEFVEILRDNIHNYNRLLYHSLNMVTALVEDDMISFYEIYDVFDNLNMFDSKWERDVSQKLSNIGEGLNSLMYEIRDMSERISNSLDNLTYATKETNRVLNQRLGEINSSIRVLDEGLGEINSSIKTNNLLTLINTYQTYKINKNTKSLR